MSLPSCSKRSWIRYGICLILASVLIVSFAAGQEPGYTQTNTAGNGTISVGVPGILLSPVGDHYVGDNFTINGYTNLAIGDQLIVNVYSSSFGPTNKGQASGASGASGTVTVTYGTYGANSWSFPVNTTGFSPDTYLVMVSAITIQNARAEGSFNLLPVPAVTTTVPTVNSTSASPPLVVSSTTRVPVPTTTAQSPLSIGCVLVAIVVLVILRRVR